MPELFSTAAAINGTSLGFEQWRSSKLLSDVAYRLPNVPAFSSMADLSMGFVAKPEIEFAKSGLNLTQA